MSNTPLFDEIMLGLYSGCSMWLVTLTTAIL